MKLPSFLQSSVDPTKLSLTVKAAIVGIIPFLYIINKVTGLNLTEDLVNQIANSIQQNIIAIWAAGSLLSGLWGLLRKLRQ